MTTWPEKDPSEVATYTFSWGADLATGETVSSASITVTDGLTVQAQGITTPVVSVRLAGGNPGRIAAVTCEVVTSGGQTLIDTAYLPIREK